MAILEEIKAAGLKEYGVYPEDLAEKLAAHANADALVVALNNADTEGAALSLLRADAQKVFHGMTLIAEVLGTAKKVLHIPDYASDLMETLAGQAKRDGNRAGAGPRECSRLCRFLRYPHRHHGRGSRHCE